jgi:hypothetical protein
MSAASTTSNGSRTILSRTAFPSGTDRFDGDFTTLEWVFIHPPTA